MDEHIKGSSSLMGFGFYKFAPSRKLRGLTLCGVRKCLDPSSVCPFDAKNGVVFHVLRLALDTAEVQTLELRRCMNAG